jgi:hypothetical protein
MPQHVIINTLHRAMKPKLTTDEITELARAYRSDNMALRRVNLAHLRKKETEDRLRRLGRTPRVSLAELCK